MVGKSLPLPVIIHICCFNSKTVAESGGLVPPSGHRLIASPAPPARGLHIETPRSAIHPASYATLNRRAALPELKHFLWFRRRLGSRRGRRVTPA